MCWLRRGMIWKCKFSHLHCKNKTCNLIVPTRESKMWKENKEQSYTINVSVRYTVSLELVFTHVFFDCSPDRRSTKPHALAALVRTFVICNFVQTWWPWRSTQLPSSTFSFLSSSQVRSCCGSRDSWTQRRPLTPEKMPATSLKGQKLASLSCLLSLVVLSWRQNWI